MQPMSVAAKPPSGLRPPGDLAATRRSGQFTCYKTGQIYLLLTVFDFVQVKVVGVEKYINHLIHWIFYMM